MLTCTSLRLMEFGSSQWGALYTSSHCYMSSIVLSRVTIIQRAYRKWCAKLQVWKKKGYINMDPEMLVCRVIAVTSTLKLLEGATFSSSICTLKYVFLQDSVIHYVYLFIQYTEQYHAKFFYYYMHSASHVYLTLVLPHFDYCDILLTNLNSNLAQTLQRVHNACIRFICNIRKYDHITPSLETLQCRNLDNLSDSSHPPQRKDFERAKLFSVRGIYDSEFRCRVSPDAHDVIRIRYQSRKQPCSRIYLTFRNLYDLKNVNKFKSDARVDHAGGYPLISYFINSFWNHKDVNPCLSRENLHKKRTYINDTEEEIKRGINMGNVYYYSVEKLLSPSLLSKNLELEFIKQLYYRLFCMVVKLGLSV
ncbi:hypothetical protein ANN_11353 [Periplaneta americana]|uniref:Uncharacterized protein n=1 Tax=Periplaneta americana TaxID=6978 RepID=A0ABQ8T6H2_PERAM|nr:hypothetical protein ANN_11353 [Periplaneta americana]